MLHCITYNFGMTHLAYKCPYLRCIACIKDENVTSINSMQFYAIYDKKNNDKT